ncbi:uncharacterized protein LOC111681798 [Lucilia cuprina]|uniref:uncharacterized protein LOC111681798 n=1 Tax=Lucilia cuprina TaxID=7375 RepID=UPI001F064C82|nr:uncharacterized protein LOC111681798 [Lucilia cuprina]XP_046806156.1 uncharacterized protein LOC111681798 [Lucilia cuprina]
MDNLEPWNMFTNDFEPDESNMDDATVENEDEEGDGGEDVPFSIPSPVQNMQVKEEPQEAAEEMFDDDNDNNIPLHFLSDAANNNENNNEDDSRIRNREEDDALFDFGLESSNSQNRSLFNKFSVNDKDYPNLTPEDQYYNAMVKFEDAVIYICPACGHEFSSQDAWKNHLNVIHLFNTRRGLNFIQLDKLYHECMECHKRIAMHSMENLLKHKFTHLPFRCSKCMVCKRQYKYRQDLMVHLRMTHRDDLIALLKKEHTKTKNANTQPQTIRSILSRSDGSGGPQNSARPKISIGMVKENATDLFDNIEVKNEVLNEDEEDDMMGDDSQPPPAKRPAMELPAFLDDGSTNGSAPDQTLTSRPTKSSATDEIDASLEEYVLFTCPQCGTECETQAQWRQHIEYVHEFGTRRGLNFRELLNQQAQCMSCNVIISNSSMRSLQVHKFSHLPYKKWMSCKLCFDSFNANRDIVKHLAAKHHLVSENNTPAAAAQNNDDDSQEAFGFGGGGGGGFADDYEDGGGGGGGGFGTSDSKNISAGPDVYTTRLEERDVFEQHITYICPACGKEYNDKKVWRKHIVEIHKLGELENLNFENINDRQLKCRECDKIITNAYGIQNAQQHRMTHMQYKSFAKCRLCRKTYTDRKGLIKHLRNSHKLGARGPGYGQINPVPSAAATNYGSSSGGGGTGSGANTFKPFVKKPYKIAHYPPKEIVRLSNYTYEIVHLIEDDDDDDDVTVVGGYDFAKGDAHLYQNNNSPYNTPPKRSSNSNVEQITRHKCVDCGSIFPTPQALQYHIKQEHDFVDYQNSSSNQGTQQNEEKSNDTDDLLVPSRDVDVQPDDHTTMDCNFIYLCPQCGLEFRSQIQWRRHINVEHNFDKREYLGFRALDKFRYQCRQCKDTVTSSKLKGLQDHKFRHCPYKLYLKCLLCGQSYNHKPNMIAHLRQRHNIVELADGSGGAAGSGGGGGSSMESKQQRYSSNLHTNSSTSKEFNDAPARPIRHTDPSTNNTNRPPGLKTVEDVISFHNAVDHETITYHCPSCNQSFDSHVFWRKHIVEEHNLNSREGLNFRQLDEHHYICLQCYKRVTVTHTKGAIGQLQSHKFRHLPYKSFSCTACQGEFVRKQMFFKHLDKNTNKCSGINPEASFMDGGETSSAFNNDEESGVDFNTTTTETGTSGGSSAKFSWPTRASLPAQSTNAANSSESTTENQGCFTLNCPQCGADFDTTRGWREHINIEHNLNNRTVLNFKKISAKLHLCLECNETVNGRKLRDLQVHKFKHLPYGAYLHCRYCSMKYFHISNMQEHLKNKHPNMVQKMKNYEDDCVTLDEDDEGNGEGVINNNDLEASGLDAEADDSSAGLEDVVDIDLLEAEAEIEEVDPDNVESDEQYLLG